MMRLKTTIALFMFILFFSSCVSAESCYKISITNHSGEKYQVLHPEFTNGMKVRSGGLRFQKGQTSFLFKWSDIKHISNEGKLWTIEFSSGMSDSFELGISMDMLLGQIESYGNKGEFQIYTRQVKELEVLSMVDSLPKKCSSNSFHPTVEIILQNGEKLSGSFSQNFIFINSDENLVKVAVDEITEIRVNKASKSVEIPLID